MLRFAVLDQVPEQRGPLRDGQLVPDAGPPHKGARLDQAGAQLHHGLRHGAHLGKDDGVHLRGGLASFGAGQIVPTGLGSLGPLAPFLVLRRHHTVRVALEIRHDPAVVQLLEDGAVQGPVPELVFFPEGVADQARPDEGLVRIAFAGRDVKVFREAHQQNGAGQLAVLFGAASRQYRRKHPAEALELRRRRNGGMGAPLRVHVIADRRPTRRGPLRLPPRDPAQQLYRGLERK
mmetsp:Transcript_3820/g.10850  ORF Transcript_3820/g.10850 Transcript_3820/m.10850 type:complete len:234 (-) Transcript_3820:2310-3011(-)